MDREKKTRTPIESPVRSATSLRDEFLIQSWLASSHGANDLTPETSTKRSRRKHGTERIEGAKKANKASPPGEDQLARTYVARAQQKKRIRHATKEKRNATKRRASRLSSTSRITRAGRVTVHVNPHASPPRVHPIVQVSRCAAGGFQSLPGRRRGRHGSAPRPAHRSGPAAATPAGPGCAPP